jgi:hypothetical protein
MEMAVTTLRPLNVLNAEIKTAAVEIRTLTVSGKQVTLAVFRQLKDEPLVNRDGTLNGTPWGIVNYHPDKCAEGRPHMHVVWQRGTELLRATVWVPSSYRYGEDGEFLNEFSSPNGNAALTLSIYREFAEGREPANFSAEKKVELSRLGFNAKQTADPLAMVVAKLFEKLTEEDRRHEYGGGPTVWRDFDIEHNSSSVTFLRGIVLPPEVKVDNKEGESHRDREMRRAEANPERTYRGLFDRFMRKLADRCAGWGDAEAKFEQDVAAEVKARQGYIKAVETLVCLPQLFIAV